MSNQRNDSPRCDNCGGPKAIFIENHQNLCRNCAIIHPQHREALNVLRHTQVIYPKETP